MVNNMNLFEIVNVSQSAKENNIFTATVKKLLKFPDYESIYICTE